MKKNNKRPILYKMFVYTSNGYYFEDWLVTDVLSFNSEYIQFRVFITEHAEPLLHKLSANKEIGHFTKFVLEEDENDNKEDQ